MSRWACQVLESKDFNLTLCTALCAACLFTSSVHSMAISSQIVCAVDEGSQVQGRMSALVGKKGGRRCNW